MEWRYLENTDVDRLREAFEWEMAFPTFYRDAGVYWRPTFEEALKFYQGCHVLYGLFENDEFIGMIFMELWSGRHLNIHLDLKRGHKITPKVIEQVRDDQFRQGIVSGQVWVLDRNRPLLRILKAAGFDDTGLTMRQGCSHSRVLRWTQLVVATQ